MPSDVTQDVTPKEVNTCFGQRGSGHLAGLGWSRTQSRINRAIKDRPSPTCKPYTRGVYCESAFELPRIREGSRRISQGQNRIRETRPSGIVGGLMET